MVDWQIRGTFTSLAVALILGSTACAHPTSSSYAYAELSSNGLTRAAEGQIKPGKRFEMGSIAKYACTIATLRLIDRGKLALDDNIGSVLPELDGRDIGLVTVQRLLENRSGLADGLMPALREDMTAVAAVETTTEAIRAYVPPGLEFEPGSRFSYDLVNWIVVQALVERVYGGTLKEALTELVLDPAGLETVMVLDRAADPNLQPPVTPATRAPLFLQCAGGLAGMPSDLIRLQQFVHGGGLSPSSLAAIQTIATPDEDYALGGRFRTVDGRLLDWKTGSNGPYKSLSIYDPERKIGFAAMTAQNDWAAIEQARDEWLERTKNN